MFVLHFLRTRKWQDSCQTVSFPKLLIFIKGSVERRCQKSRRSNEVEVRMTRSKAEKRNASKLLNVISARFHWFREPETSNDSVEIRRNRMGQFRAFSCEQSALC